MQDDEKAFYQWVDAEFPADPTVLGAYLACQPRYLFF